MGNNKKGGHIRIGYVIISVFVAVTLWLYVTRDLNPTQDWTITRVPVVFNGEDFLEDSNLIVSAREVTEITVTFNGRYQDVSKLNNTNVRAVVDLTDVLTQYTAPTGTHALEYELEFDTPNSNVTMVSASKHAIEVTVERLVTESIPLQAVFDGGIAENYIAGELTLSRTSVDVSGTEAAIALIDKATVTLNRQGQDISKTTQDEAPIKLIGADGAELDMEAEGLRFVNASTAIITQSVQMVKEVTLKIDIIERATATDANVSINIQPLTIKLAGDPEVLETVNEINLGTVDLLNVILSYENTYQIRIPNGTTNLSGFTSATVDIDVLNVETRRISATNISYRNLAENLTVDEIITQSLDIVLRGRELSLDQVTSESIRIVADLTEVTGPGTFPVTAKVYVDGFRDVEAVGEYQVNVRVS